MHNSSLLQVSGYELPQIAPYAFSAIDSLPGKVAVEMAEEPDKIGRILLPDKVAGKLRCDVGVVLSCKAPRSRKTGQELTMDISPGDAVLVRPYHGSWIEEFACEGYKTHRQVRFYGVHGDPSIYELTGQGDRTDTGVYELIPWNESIVAKLVGNIVVPTFGNLMIRLDNVKHDFLVLPDGVKMATQTATVAAGGSTTYKRGERVVYLPSPDDLSIELDDDLRLIRSSQVEALCT